MAILEDAINKAVEILLNEGNVCIPTETVYGLAGIANSDKAVANIYSLKQRPSFNPLILHCYSTEQVFDYVESNNLIKKIADNFWPGPITIIGYIKENKHLSKLATSGLNTIAVRIPKSQTTLEIIKKCSVPLFAPSANISNRTSATTANDIKKNFNDSIFIVEDDSCIKVGIESTILDVTNEIPTILRPGAISKEELEEKLNLSVAYNKQKTIIAPGMMAKHYSPQIDLKINVTPDQVKDKEAYLGFGNNKPINCAKYLNLSPSGNLTEAAANLYKMIYLLDSNKFSSICISPIPNTGIGIAINDRLNRASKKN